MLVKRKELKAVLESIRPGLAKDKNTNQDCHFVFTGEEVVTYNGRISISHPFESDIAFSVKGEEFYRLIDGIDEDDVNITLSGNQIKLATASTKSSMTALGKDKDTFSATHELLKGGRVHWKKLPDNFLEGISLCAFSVVPDLTAGVHNCVGVMEGYCWAVDHARASLYELSEQPEDVINIPGNAASELSKFPVVEYAIGNNWMHFRTSTGVIFSHKEMTGELDISQIKEIIPVMMEFPSFKLPLELKTVVNATVILATDLADKTGKLLKVKIASDGKITVNASNELGFVEKFLQCEYRGEEINLRINSKFLSQILERSTTMSIGSEAQRKALLFTSGSFTHLLAQTNPSPKAEAPKEA